jgi:hypothetical protein
MSYQSNFDDFFANAISTFAPTVTLVSNGTHPGTIQFGSFFFSLLFSTFTIIGEAFRCPQQHNFLLLELMVVLHSDLLLAGAQRVHEAHV